MIIIKCKDQKIESCLKKYRQKVDRVGQLEELRSRQRFEKPSIKRRKEILTAKYKNTRHDTSEI